MQQRSHIIASVKTLAALIAAADDEVIEAVREHAREVAIQGINNGLFAARKDLKAGLQVSELFTKQEIKLRSTFGLAPTVVQTRNSVKRHSGDRAACCSATKTSYTKAQYMPCASINREGPLGFVQFIPRTTRLASRAKMPRLTDFYHRSRSAVQVSSRLRYTSAGRK